MFYVLTGEVIKVSIAHGTINLTSGASVKCKFSLDKTIITKKYNKGRRHHNGANVRKLRTWEG